MIERTRSRMTSPFFCHSSAALRGGSHGAAALLSAAVLLGCGDSQAPGGEGGSGGTTAGSAGSAVTAGTGGSAGTGVSGGGAGGSVAGAGGAGAGGATAAGGSAGSAGSGTSGSGGAGGAGMGGLAGGGAGGAGGTAGSGGMAGMEDLPPAMLSETGLFTARAADGTLTLAEGVREFEPRYWLWSDASDKKRYVYLPPGSKIDTTDADHWVFPVGAKLWKSFIRGGQLVETRLLERIDEEPNKFRYATYYWRTIDAADAERQNYRDQRMNAAGTPHDIPNGQMCERCHNGLKDHALGFSALQLNHDRPGVTLATLNDEGWLTTPIPLTIGMPGEDELTQDVLGYLHANCGNCHNDQPGLPVENIPPPQMYLRVLVGDTLETAGVFSTAVNQPVTGSNELGIDYRIKGGDPTQSAAFVRMGLRLHEDQMPPIGTEDPDTDGGLMLLDTWIRTLEPPTPQ